MLSKRKDVGRPPLSERDSVEFLLGSEVPFVPENAVHLASVLTQPSQPGGLEYLDERARTLGANLVFIKSSRNFSYSFNADFFYAEGLLDDGNLDVPQKSRCVDSVYYHREQLVDAIKSQKPRAAARHLDKLRDASNSDCISISLAEIETLLMHGKMYPQLLKEEVAYHRNYFKERGRRLLAASPEKDALKLFVQRIEKEKPMDENFEALMNLVEKDLQHANMLETQKKELLIFLMLRFAYLDKSVGDKVECMGRVFVSENPNHPDARWIEHSVVEPLERRDYFNWKW